MYNLIITNKGSWIIFHDGLTIQPEKNGKMNENFIPQSYIT